MTERAPDILPYDDHATPINGIIERNHQEALLKAGALQSAIFNSANFSSIATDANGVIQIFNVGAEQMLGYTATEVMNKITPADISDPQEVIARAESLSLELGTPITPGFEALVFKASRGIEDIYELTYIRKDGSRFPAVVSVTALRDAHDAIIGYLLIGTDNTARKHAEESIHAASQYARSLIEASQDPLVTISAQGKITDVNAATEQVTGISRNDLINSDFAEYFSDPEKAREGYEQAFLQGFVTDYPLAIRHVSGKITYVLYNASLYRDGNGNVLGVFAAARDITARKHAEEELRKAGALQSAIFNSANFSSIATDANGVIQIFNVGAEQMLGYTAAEVMNKITPADISDPQEVIARAGSLSLELGTSIMPGFEALVFKASRGIEDIYELTYIRKDGSRFPAVVSVTALRDAHDAIIGYLLIGTDNTARKQAEEELLKAGALQSAIFNSANFSSIATDGNGVIQIFNVGAEQMLGYTAAEVMNKITPADISDPQEVIARAESLSLELGTPITPGFEALVFKASRGIEDIYELTYIRKDGSRFPAVVSVTALRDAHDTIIGYLLIGTDNTARKHAEEKLRWTEESFRLMVESVTDYAIVMLDTEGCVMSWNAGAERIKGYTTEDIVGQHFSQFYLEEDIINCKPQRDLDAVIANGRFEDEGWRVRKDKSSFWANVVYTAIRDHLGNLRGVAKLTRDLTERRQVEITLTNAKSAAEKANQAKSDFLSSMSHELRSPLNAILGFAQLMESDSPPPTSSQMESIEQILNGGWYLLDLINEILDLAVIESGKVSLLLESVSLAEVMLECQTMIEPQAQKRGIHMTFPQFDISCFVQADRTRVKQVMINLLSNSIKYNQKNGAVAVVVTRNSRGRIRISVTDTGAGLSAEKMEQLFQPFNRLGQESDITEGTGIGLVVTKRLVELMGGVIGVESTIGVGSVFWIELIAATSPQNLSSTIIESIPTIVQMQVQNDNVLRTLLYVEDNSANLKLVEQLIARRPDMKLLSAGDGLMGIQIAREFQPKVILMDINLPGISGIEALKILREDPTTAHIPVVAISANAIPRDIEIGMEAGFFRYLTKPVKVNEFFSTLDEALEFATKETNLCK